MSEFDQNNGTGPQSRIEVEAAEAAEAMRYKGDAPRVPSVDDLERELRARGAQPTFQPTAHIVDSVSLSRAQGRFINAQTKFLVGAYADGSRDYYEALGAYSRAQTELITAMQVALNQAGVI